MYRPIARGQMWLPNKNPRSVPLLKYNYLNNQQDLDTCIEGVRTLQKIIYSKSYARFRFKRRVPA